jgi:hypothetical protein
MVLLLLSFSICATGPASLVVTYNGMLRFGISGDQSLFNSQRDVARFIGDIEEAIQWLERN